MHAFAALGYRVVAPDLRGFGVRRFTFRTTRTRSARSLPISRAVSFRRYDFVRDTERSSLMEPMKTACSRLTIDTIASGHWMMHERAVATSEALVRFARSIAWGVIA